MTGSISVPIRNKKTFKKKEFLKPVKRISADFLNIVPDIHKLKLCKYQPILSLIYHPSLDEFMWRLRDRSSRDEMEKSGSKKWKHILL